MATLESLQGQSSDKGLLSGLSDNPILSFFNPFLKKKGFDAVIERFVKGAENKGFTNAAFQSMIKKVGWKSGEAWCAYYVKLVMMQFYSFDRNWLNKNLSGSAAGNFYAVQRLNRSGDTRYIIVTTNTPQVGDIVCWGRAGRGHTGIVTEVINNNKIKSIEGNTSLDGKREGDGVRVLSRTVRVGSNNSEGLVLLGYIRRNFTEEEKKKLYFDEQEQTLKFK
jgi:hypothetical protein